MPRFSYPDKPASVTCGTCPFLDKTMPYCKRHPHPQALKHRGDWCGEHPWFALQLGIAVHDTIQGATEPDDLEWLAQWAEREGDGEGTK